MKFKTTYHLCNPVTVTRGARFVSYVDKLTWHIIFNLYNENSLICVKLIIVSVSKTIIIEIANDNLAWRPLQGTIYEITSIKT